MSEPIVVLRDVHKTYHGGAVPTPVLCGIDLEIERGSFTVVLGASGSGKTTMLNLIGALDSPDRGSLCVAGQELAGLSPTARAAYRRDRIGFVFQFYNLLPTLTARENIELALELGGLGRAEMRARAGAFLARVGLAGKADFYPAQLSGGEQQRVAVARALARQPALILADEPTGNLDAGTGQQITELMVELQRERALSVIAVTHNERLAASAQRVIRIESGRLVDQPPSLSAAPVPATPAGAGAAVASA